jgi:hypothetical protein
MRIFAFSCCCTALLAGCGQQRNAEDRAARDTAAAASAATAEPAEPRATISLADVAGKWKVRSTDEAGGTPAEIKLVATGDTSGWTMTGSNGKPVPVRVVAVAGDSIVTEAGPYESFVRKGVQVTTRTVSRLEGGRLVGTIEARYTTKGGDSVVQRRSEGTRAP